LRGRFFASPFGLASRASCTAEGGIGLFKGSYSCLCVLNVKLAALQCPLADLCALVGNSL
jgi:hypothetical protein